MSSRIVTSSSLDIQVGSVLRPTAHSLDIQVGSVLRPTAHSLDIQVGSVLRPTAHSLSGPLFLVSVALTFLLLFAIGASAQAATETQADSDSQSEDASQSTPSQATLITETNIISESLAAPVSTESPSEQEADADEQPSQGQTSDAAVETTEEAPTASPGSQTLEGTIFANRTDWAATFFVEGELRRVEPQRSTGIVLPRSESGLNLFSCEANVDKDDPNCFWDPYVVVENGFYEILKIAAENGSQKLIIEEARAPASGQIWVQNRTELGELIFWEDELITLPPTGLREFDLSGNAGTVFYMRSCIVQGDEFACEWLPHEVQAGIYYSMDEVRNATDQINSYYSSLQLFPIENADGTALQSGPDSLCTLLVPSLNIRSGPGLQYLILSQAFASTTEDVVIRVTGSDETGQWLATDGSIIEGGWVVYSPELISCTDGWDQLPITEISDGRLAPVPEEVAAPAEGEVAEENGEASADGEAEEAAVETESPPPGQALLIIENAFEADVRFTFLEEVDLQPGQRTSIVINAGRVQFSVSSPWRGGMAGNAEFIIEPDETKRMFLYFIPDPKGDGDWLMRYE